jgi:hypothetical protein
VGRKKDGWLAMITVHLYFSRSVTLSHICTFLEPIIGLDTNLVANDKKKENISEKDGTGREDEDRKVGREKESKYRS